jgi:hypothetical protein
MSNEQFYNFVQRQCNPLSLNSIFDSEIISTYYMPIIMMYLLHSTIEI